MCFKRKLAYCLMFLLLLGAAHWLYTDTFIERWRFYGCEPEKWKSARPEDRYYMARYLVDKHMLTGKSRAEVLSELGDPSVSSSNFLLYNLGPERGSLFRIDDDWLELTFDAASKGVINARIRPD